MSRDGKSDDGKSDGAEELAAEHAIAEFRVAADRTVGAWSDAKLNAVIARLRQDGTRKPDNFALLMFLEDARLRRLELRFHSDGKGDPSVEAVW
jgi:hypothetical protein